MNAAEPLQQKTQLQRLLKNKIIGIVLKVVVVGLLLGVLYFQLFRGEEMSLPEIWLQFKARLSLSNIYPAILVLLLMPINWSIETGKWQHLMLNIEQLPFHRALRAILAGLTFSLFTPNRVGEYGGRILLVSQGNRINSVFATLVGSFSQWVVLFVGGVLALFVFLLAERTHLAISWTVIAGLILAGMALSAFLLYAYFNVRRLVHWTARFRWTRRWAKRLHEGIFQYYTPKQLSITLLYSAARYFVYSLQYFLLLNFFGLDISVWEGFTAIMLIYLLQTGLPIPPATGLVMRGNIALFVFGFFVFGVVDDSALRMAILASTFGLWLVNVVLPAIFGAIFIVQIKSLLNANADKST